MGSVEQLLEFLAQTLDDGKISRGEWRAFTQTLEQSPLSTGQQSTLLAEAAKLAGRRSGRQKDRDLLKWMADVARAVAASPLAEANPPTSEVLFAPGDPVVERIGEKIAATRQSLQLCVFTITDNQLARQILEAHRRGVAVRLITDDDKSLDPGSDILRLHQAGIPVRTDKNPNHMHHKFAILDQKTLLTGSYNWTFSASRHNRENLLISEDRQLLLPYQTEFETLWRLYAPS